MTYIGRLILVALLSWNALAYVDAAKAGVVSDEAGEEKREAFIEDVNAKQLERLIAEEDYVAVFWCKYNLPPLICGLSPAGLRIGFRLMQSTCDHYSVSCGGCRRIPSIPEPSRTLQFKS
jgi:hypothetical protein